MNTHAPYNVAPHAGAWIETTGAWSPQGRSDVAPHAGAWIETKMSTLKTANDWSRPTRARGLKPYVRFAVDAKFGSRAPRGRVD